MPLEDIIVQGARENNLKNIDVTIPRNKLVVITGVSGSGKSSLAFDTIYAEGQRRYVESLSAYARQFLGRMEKPAVDYIDGLSPSISIDQKGVSKNPRSTVGTVTEIYDYLRLLYARVGRPHCYVCKLPVQKQSIQQIVDLISTFPYGTKIQIMAPMIKRRKGEHKEIFAVAQKSGYVRVRVNGDVRDLSESFSLDKRKWHTIEIIVDRLAIGDGDDPSRLADSIESALNMADGTVLITDDDGNEHLYSEKLACLNCNISLGEIEPRTFSFNNPYGACPECTGLGYRLEVDPDLVIPDPNLALENGAIQPWSRSGQSSPWMASMIKSLAIQYNFSTHIPFKQLSKEHINLILFGAKGKMIRMTHRTKRGHDYQWDTKYEGVINNLERRYRDTDSDHTRAEITRYMASRPCNKCEGQRLKPEALAITVGGAHITEVTRQSVGQVQDWVSGLDGQKISLSTESNNNPLSKTILSETKHTHPDGQELPAENVKLQEPLNEREKTIASQILKEIRLRLKFLADIGLDYLTLERTASTLSGGEAQRIRLATQIGSGLMGVLYVCDEPSVGLHPVDDSRLIDTLQRLRDLGNTVLIVEHDEAIMRSADHIVDLGPGAGEHGGHVVATGTINEIISVSQSITGQYLGKTRRIPIPQNRRSGSGKFLAIHGAQHNNLKNIDVRIPLGQLVCITGVSGSGKSTLIDDILFKTLALDFHKSREKPGKCRSITGSEAIDKIVNIDQSPIGRTPRSNPATYTGTFTPIRELFANIPESKIKGYKPGRFSFNVKGGRCETCAGDGHINIEMHFLPDVTVPCEVCHGDRYNREALEIKFKGKNIAEVLNMTVTEALNHFTNIPRIRNKLETMHDVGLGYIRLGQPATHLSGGEAQRVKLSTELSKRATGSTLYILDEPTTGLSFEDCAHLVRVLHRLVDSGNTVILIEHHLDLVKNGDWIIDLGPGAGDKGGCLVAEGTPEDLVQIPHSQTGKFLKAHIQSEYKMEKVKENLKN